MNLLTLEINRQCGVRVEKLSYNEEIISSISASRLQVISVQEHLKLYKKKKNLSSSVRCLKHFIKSANDYLFENSDILWGR